MSDAETEGVKIFSDLLNSLKRAENTFSQLASEQAKQCQLIQNAASTASQTAVEASEAFSTSKPRLMALVALSAALLVSGAGIAAYWVGRHDGWAAGHLKGYQTALTANSAASWANTASGDMARKLDDLGNLQALATCRLPGFSLQPGKGDEHWCVIAGSDGKGHGWRIP